MTGASSVIGILQLAIPTTFKQVRKNRKTALFLFPLDKSPKQKKMLFNSLAFMTFLPVVFAGAYVGVLALP